jgi:carbon-monoxide dehydrogenase large subunit
MRDMLAAIMGIEKQTLHVITEDVGAFGPEERRLSVSALLVAAKSSPRALDVGRSEAFNSDNQARDNVTGELAIDAMASSSPCARAVKSRRLCRLRRHSACDQQFRPLFSGHVRHSGSISACNASTQHLPTGPYRGAGPEANY